MSIAPSTGIASDCLRWLVCLLASLLRGCGSRLIAPGQATAVSYSSLVHRVHTPILMIGLVALLGVWRDPAHLAIVVAAAFGMTCLFLIQRFFDRERRPVQTIQPRHALITHCRATESNSLAPVEWRCAMSRSGGAPPPAPAFFASGQLTRRCACHLTFGPRSVLFVGLSNLFSGGL